MSPAKRTRVLDGPRAGLSAGPLLWVALLTALPSGGMLLAQQQTSGVNGQVSNRPVRPSQPDLDQTLSVSPSDPIFQERRLRQLNAVQHKAMVSDADRLLKLVTALNEEIDNTSPASLTPDQLRRVAEIEKLAHSVKDKMRNSVQASPVFLEPTQPLPNTPSRR